MNVAHTPEPWMISSTIGDYKPKHRVFLLGVAQSAATEHPVLIAEVPRHKTGQADRIPVHQQEWDANIRLLSAAPRLLRVLADLETAARAVSDMTHAAGIGLDDPLLTARLCDLWNRANEARAAVQDARSGG